MTGAPRRFRSAISSLTLIVCVSIGLAGCGGGDGGDSSAATTGSSSSATNPTPSPSNPSPSPSPSPGTGGNQAPKITGTPSTHVALNAKYVFSPSATDPDNDTLGFSIKNKPEWASFNTSDGTLTGTPTRADTYANIVISVNDGSTSVSLPAFSITVDGPEVPGAVTLTWDPPTTNEDGTALVDLAGYTVVYGPDKTQMYESIQIDQPGLYRHVFDNLPAGTYYFAVKAFTASGAQSGLSNVVSKVVR